MKTARPKEVGADAVKITSGGWGKPLKLHGPPKIPPEGRGSKMKICHYGLFDSEGGRTLGHKSGRGIAPAREDLWVYVTAYGLGRGFRAEYTYVIGRFCGGWRLLAAALTGGPFVAPEGASPAFEALCRSLFQEEVIGNLLRAWEKARGFALGGTRGTTPRQEPYEVPEEVWAIAQRVDPA